MAQQPVCKSFPKYHRQSPDFHVSSPLCKSEPEGSKENELRHQAAKLGIESEVEFKGYVPNDKLPDEINRMNALVNPSRYEMLGVSTLEGMACGVPTIATDTDGSSEIILNGVTGYTVKNGNLSALVYRLK